MPFTTIIQLLPTEGFAGKTSPSSSVIERISLPSIRTSSRKAYWFKTESSDPRPVPSGTDSWVGESSHRRPTFSKMLTVRLMEEGRLSSPLSGADSETASESAAARTEEGTDTDPPDRSRRASSAESNLLHRFIWIRRLSVVG